MLLYKSSLDGFEKIEFENDSAFTEPLLFTYFNSKHRSKIDQILWSHFKTENKHATFELLTNNKGVCYIPEYGYLRTDIKEDRLIFSYDGEIKIYRDDHMVNYEFEPIRKIGDSHISVFSHSFPIAGSFLPRLNR